MNAEVNADNNYVVFSYDVSPCSKDCFIIPLGETITKADVVKLVRFFLGWIAKELKKEEE